MGPAYCGWIPVQQTTLLSFCRVASFKTCCNTMPRCKNNLKLKLWVLCFLNIQLLGSIIQNIAKWHMDLWPNICETLISWSAEKLAPKFLPLSVLKIIFHFFLVVNPWFLKVKVSNVGRYSSRKSTLYWIQAPVSVMQVQLQLYVTCNMMQSMQQCSQECRKIKKKVLTG